MPVDVTVLALLITLVSAIIGIGIWAGKISERVAHNRKDIDENLTDLKVFTRENKEEHKDIIKRLDVIRNNQK